MYNIRFNVFETNSSSVHCMVILPKEKYMDWEFKDLYYCEHDDKLYKRNEVYEILKGSFFHFEYDFAIMRFKHEGVLPNSTDDAKVWDNLRDDVKQELDKLFADYGYYSFDRWNYDMMDEDETVYRTPGGEDIIIRAKFGYDG